jgi:hypothetical protein
MHEELQMQHSFDCPNCRKTIAVTDEMLQMSDCVIDCAYCHIDLTIPAIKELLDQIPAKRYSATFKPSLQKQIRISSGKKVSVILRRSKSQVTSGIVQPAAPLTPLPQALPDEEKKKTAPIAEMWYATEGEEIFGPVTRTQLARLAAEGKITRQSLVWTTLSPQPVKVMDLAGLAAIVKDPEPLASTYNDELFDIGNDENAIMCPYCWHRFLPGDVMFISNHPDLLGDPVLGEGEQQRFLPTRFNASGLAVDSGGIVCPDMACPRCHLRLPSPIMDTHPTFLSIVGSPGSGKSYFLASAVWKLRTALPRVFGARFMDVDAQTNQWVNDYEEKLFLQSDPNAFQSIAKTDEQAGNVYRQVKLNGLPVFLPLPSLFTLSPPATVGSAAPAELHTLILYDNAGEHFQAGHDSAAAPGTKHLLYAEGIVFLYDPTEDPRFRPFFKPDVVSHRKGAALQRQDVLLVEMLNRIRKHHNLPSTARFNKPLIIALSKADLLDGFPELDCQPWASKTPGGYSALDIGAIARMSYKVRTLMSQCAPELVSMVESFADQVLFMPFSSLGHQPLPSGIRPCDVAPKWVEVPFLYILSRLGHVRSLRNHDYTSPAINLTDPALTERHITGTNPYTGEALAVPFCYSGHTVLCPETGGLIKMPVVEGVAAI